LAIKSLAQNSSQFEKKAKFEEIKIDSNAPYCVFGASFFVIIYFVPVYQDPQKFIHLLGIYKIVRLRK